MTSISTFNIPHTQWINHVSYRMWTESSAAWFGVMISRKKPECLLVKGWLHVQVHIYQSVSSVAQSCPTLRPHGLQHARPPCPSPTPRACSDSCPLSQWCHPTISSLLSLSPPAFSLSQHQGLFQWVSHYTIQILKWARYVYSWMHYFEKMAKSFCYT